MAAYDPAYYQTALDDQKIAALQRQILDDPEVQAAMERARQDESSFNQDPATTALDSSATYGAQPLVGPNGEDVLAKYRSRLPKGYNLGADTARIEKGNHAGLWALGSLGALVGGGFLAGGLGGATGAASVADLGAVSPAEFGGAAGIGGSSVLGGVGGALSTGLSTAEKIAKLFGAGGKAIGNATTAAGNNALQREILALQAAERNSRNLLDTEQLNQSGQLGTERLNLEGLLGTERLNLEGTLGANNSNISGQSAFENELLNRAKTESMQRQDNLKDVYRASATEYPSVSPFNPVGAPTNSAQYLDTLKTLSKQGADRLSKPPDYATPAMPGLQPYKPITAPTHTFTPNTFTPNPVPAPIDIKNVPGATGTSPGIGQQIGSWVGPGLSIADLIAQLWPQRKAAA